MYSRKAGLNFELANCPHLICSVVAQWPMIIEVAVLVHFHAKMSNC